jgi:hypothetical protein
MSGDLFEILFILAFILFGLLGGRKRKKKPGAGEPQRPQPRPRPVPRPAPERSAARQQRSAPPETAQDALLRELEGLLTGRAPRPVEQEAEWMPVPSDRVPDPVEARSLESLEVEETVLWGEGLDRASEARDTARWTEGRNRAARTLETLEEAGEASHRRFHERYDFSTRTEPRTARGPTFDVRDVRRAVVWSEILGSPVSMRE